MEATNRATPPRRQPPGTFRFNRKLFHQLADQGAFEGLRVELLEGEIIVMAPQGGDHAFAVQEVGELLYEAKPKSLRLRTQLPIAPDDENEPEPDFALVPVGTQGDGEAPGTAVLVVELSVNSLRDDLGRKARIYARAGIPEYWVIDLKARELFMHRAPGAEGYADVTRSTGLRAVKSTAVPGLVLDLTNIFVKR